MASRGRAPARKLVPWLLLAAWLVIIYCFSDQPYSGRTTQRFLGAVMNVPVRKAAHFLEYLILFVLWRNALAARRAPGRALARSDAAILATIACAALDEWHQSFVPGRSPAVADVLIDSAGALAGFALLVLLASRRSCRRRAEQAGRAGGRADEPGR